MGKQQLTSTVVLQNSVGLTFILILVLTASVIDDGEQHAKEWHFKGALDNILKFSFLINFLYQSNIDY